MANGSVNPLTAPLQALKQVGEQANMGLQQLGAGMAQAASTGLDSLMAAAPPLPGVPGVAAGQFPTPASLMPGNLGQALSQVENILIPAGLPRPSQALTRVVTTPTPTPTPQPRATTTRVPTLAGGS